jgi:catalase
VKFHFKTDQGIETLTSDESARVAGANPQAHQIDLVEAIERGDHPSWTLKVQVMPESDAASYRFDPFDLTKVWPHVDYPLVQIGKLVLDRNPDNYFGEVEQVAFDPGNFVPGIGPSPDKMLQGRLFAYGDAHRYRLGINHTQLPVNAPRGVSGGARNYGRDGSMSFQGNGGRAKNYEPNSFDGPVQTNRPAYNGLASEGVSGATPNARHAEDDDFVQAGALYRLMPVDEQQRLVDNIAGSLAQLSRDDIIARSIAHFRAADSSYGERVAAAVKALRQ